MKKWIMSANPLIYNHRLAFEQQNYIDWKQTRNFEIGDIVYIYCTKTISRVQYKTIVEKINMTSSEISDDSRFWVKNVGNIYGRYMRLRLLGFTDRKELTFTELRKHGMTYAPQSPSRVKPELSDYLDFYFGGFTNE